MVVPFRKEHVERVAHLHCRALPGLLTALGPAAAAAFYEGYLSSPRCVAFVDEHEGTVRGFALGSPDPEEMRRDGLRARAPVILCAILASALRRPSVLRHLAHGWVRFATAASTPGRPADVHRGWDDARGAGIGSALLRAFQGALRRQGVTRYELSVEANSREAVAFYEARGLRELSTYRQFGTAYRRYALELPPVRARKRNRWQGG